MSMTADSLKYNLSNPQKVFWWDCNFVSPVGGGDGEVLELRCQSTEIPGRGVDSITIPYKGTPGFKVPGRRTTPQRWTVTFVEGTDKRVYEAIYAWEQAISHDRLGTGLSDVLIKADLYVRLHDALGVTTTRIRLKGCYPEDRPTVPLPYGESRLVYYTVNFSYDDWEDASSGITGVISSVVGGIGGRIFGGIRGVLGF